MIQTLMKKNRDNFNLLNTLNKVLQQFVIYFCQLYLSRVCAKAIQTNYKTDDDTRSIEARILSYNQQGDGVETSFDLQ